MMVASGECDEGDVDVYSGRNAYLYRTCVINHIFTFLKVYRKKGKKI